MSFNPFNIGNPETENPAAAEYNFAEMESFGYMSTLILVSTNIHWKTLWSLLSKTPCLNELHLSKNEFTSVEIEVEGVLQKFSEIKKVLFNGNPVKSWDEISKLGKHIKCLFSGYFKPICKFYQLRIINCTLLGQVFPNLEHLGLTDCQIECIPALAHENFKHLYSLSLTNNPLKELIDVSHLQLFPALTELRIQGVQLFPEFTGMYFSLNKRNLSLVN